MASVPKIASSSSASLTTDIRPVAGARNVATTDIGPVRALSGIDPAGSEAPGYTFRPHRPEVADRNERRPLPSLFSRFSPTTSAVTAALNVQKAAEADGGESRPRRTAVRPSNGQAAQAATLYEAASQYLSGNLPARGGFLNLTF